MEQADSFASASTVRGPWLSRSCSSRRLGAPSAFPTRANCSYRLSLNSRWLTRIDEEFN